MTRSASGRMSRIIANAFGTSSTRATSATAMLRLKLAAGLHCVRDIPVCIGVGWVQEDGELGGTRHEFAHQPDLLATIGKIRGSGDIAARPSQACDQPGTDRIARVHHHDRDRAGRLSRGTAGGHRWRNDDIDLARRKLTRELTQTFRIALCGTFLDHDVLAFDIAERGEALAKHRTILQGRRTCPSSRTKGRRCAESSTWAVRG